MVRYYARYHSESTILRISFLVNSMHLIDFAMLFTPRKGGGGKSHFHYLLVIN